MILAIFGLSGVSPGLLLPIAIIVFGAALLIQGGTMLSEYARLIFPSRTTQLVEHFGGGSLSVLFLVGAAGIVLGILTLIGINPAVLNAVAIIIFGAALVLSSSSVTNLQALKAASARASEPTSGSEILAAEMATGSAGTQALTGLAAIVLGILAVVGVGSATMLSLVAILALGATIILTGSSLSGAMLSFMKPVTVETEPQASPHA
jgi:hypothetical protein